MNKKFILNRCGISPDENDHLRTKNIDIDSIVHIATYDLSQSSYDRRVEYNDKNAQYFLQVVFPLAVKKVSSKLAKNEEWVNLRNDIKEVESHLCNCTSSIKSFVFRNKNHLTSDLKRKQLNIIEKKFDKIEDESSALMRVVHYRDLAKNAIFQQNFFRKEFMVDHEFKELSGRKFNFKRLMSEKSQEHSDWRKSKLNELESNLDESHFSDTLVKSFVDFVKSLNINTDYQVYGVGFCSEFMPEIIDRIINHTDNDWSDEVMKLKDLASFERKTLSHYEKLAHQIIRLEDQWEMPTVFHGTLREHILSASKEVEFTA